jgi:hypothetical protein
VCASAVESVFRWAMPSSINRLLRCPCGCWLVVMGSDTVEDVDESDSAVAWLLVLTGCGRSTAVEDMRCRGMAVRGEDCG